MNKRYEAKTYDGAGWYVRDTVLGYNGGPYESEAEAKRQAKEFNKLDRAGRKATKPERP